MADLNMGRILEDLVETLEDSRQGFSEAADELGQEGHHELANELREFSTQRARFSTELRDLAVARGLMVHQSGSLAGALHRKWLSTREALSSDKAASVLEASESGEDHALDEYDKALTGGLPEEVREVVSRQAAEIETAHQRIRSLREEAPT